MFWTDPEFEITRIQIRALNKLDFGSNSSFGIKLFLKRNILAVLNEKTIYLSGFCTHSVQNSCKTLFFLQYLLIKEKKRHVGTLFISDPGPVFHGV